MRNTSDMTLTLGPVLFNWEVEKWRDFYFRIADEAPVDHVVLGEIVCSKREPFFAPKLPEIIDRLEAAGKKVILGSPILVMNKRERTLVGELMDAGYPVEINDMTAMRLRGDAPFTVGPFVNVYNEGVRAFFEQEGAERISLTGELNLASISEIAKSSQAPVEVFAFGRMPLAIAARCYHARSYGLAKDSCQYVCGKHTDGLDVDTVEGQPFLCVNGVQTLSYTAHVALGDIGALAEAGVSALRLSPHDVDMIAVTSLFRDCLDGAIDADQAVLRLDEIMDGLPFSNGFLHGKEGFRARGAIEEYAMMT